MDNECITGVMDYAPFYCCDDIPGNYYVFIVKCL